ncbi:hypothetical protein ACQR16_30945 [Bradyrhizobium oligotrophicum]|uniref:hypothetical protein n=1 Tax=Bradyrhizobium oligotrophicum TaxID=44255 RepID=UPI003EB85CED
MNPGLEYGQAGEIADALLAFFAVEIVGGLPSSDASIESVRSVDPTFNASIEYRAGASFTIGLNEGCVDGIFRALNSSDEHDLTIARRLTEDLFGSQEEIDAVLNGMLNLCVFFVLLHEFSHIACGHIHAAVGNGQSGFTLNEIGTSDRLGDSGLAGGEVTGVDANKVFELEADSTAYELLLEHAETILRASPGLDRIAWEEKAGAEAVPKMAFLACALVVALTEGQRHEAGRETGHPRALTRILNLCLANLLLFLPGDWRVEEFVRKLKIDEAAEAVIFGRIVPTIVDAIEFCRIGCAGMEMELSLRYEAEIGSVTFGRAFAKDFASLAVGREEELATEPGQEYAALQRVRRLLIPRMGVHRQASWWTI